MAYARGGYRTNLGIHELWSGPPARSQTVLDATNESVHIIGHAITSDGGSHTIDTTGSSKIEFATASVTLSDAATVIKAGITDVIADGLADHTTNVINFDVFSQHSTANPIAANSWISATPTSGTKTIAHGDIIAFCVQITNRAGSDVVQVAWQNTGAAHHLPTARSYLGGSYAALTGKPMVFFRFSDGAYGTLNGFPVWNTVSTRAFNVNTAGADEYGELFQWPFPVRVDGIWATSLQASSTADYEMNIYSDPLGTPVLQRTYTYDSSITPVGVGRHVECLYSSPYDVPANTPIAATLRPTTTSGVTMYYVTVASADHWPLQTACTQSYGISRLNNTGAFASDGSGLNHYYIGVMGGAFDNAVSAGGGLLSHPGMRGGFI